MPWNMPWNMASIAIIEQGCHKSFDAADLEREQLGLKREEQKLIREIKAAAAKNNTPTVRVLAKSLVRLRGQQARLQASAAQMRGVSSSMVVSLDSISIPSTQCACLRALLKPVLQVAKQGSGATLERGVVDWGSVKKLVHCRSALRKCTVSAPAW